jgi:UPF0042 nucleotide-binding protein
MKTPKSALEIVFITGMSGSGKSVALHALEDAGFYCVDNLPPELLLAFVDLQTQQAASHRIAIAVDVRSAKSLPALPAVLTGLQARGVAFKLVFLEASDETLLHRYSETRRLHPLSNPKNSDQRLALQDAITLERKLLAEVRERAHIIDTGFIKATKLQSIVKDLVDGNAQTAVPANTLTVVFESFAFKRGVPLDADYVFDVRMLPNPHYEPTLKALTGRDPAVIDYLKASSEVLEMQTQITAFARHWLPALQSDHRSYVTVAIGCTGGQHRSVYLVEQLAKAFKHDWPVLIRHRELA